MQSFTAIPRAKLMFTGIIEAIGRVKEVKKGESGATLEVDWAQAPPPELDGRS